MRFPCCDQRRLEVIAHSGSSNAIEFLEVLDHAAPPGVPRQRTLFVRLLRPGFALVPANVRIRGGARIPTVNVLWCAAGDALPPVAEPGLGALLEDPARTLVIRTDGAGDFSRYTLSLVADPAHDRPPPGFDPKLSSIDFSFKVECPADFDCRDVEPCPPKERDRPEIDYLAKDYQGFRRLLLDRLSLLVPDWSERSPADIGITIVELLAYALDNLSYRQDAIANEAYLATARRRVSVRRHARLVDYVLSEGCNARAFVQLEVDAAGVLAQKTVLFTKLPELSTQIVEGDPARRDAAVADAVSRGALVFQTAHDVALDPEQNLMEFYTWGDRGCCLPRGATRATLREHRLSLAPGTILAFEELRSPSRDAEFRAEDRDPTRRCFVRLTEVTFDEDPSGGLFEPSPSSAPVPVTEIEWSAEDALPFPICISVVERPDLVISVARGNVVLCDHGREMASDLGSVPSPLRWFAAPGGTGHCEERKAVPVPVRFRPALPTAPLGHGFDLTDALAAPPGHDAFRPASSLLEIDPRTAMPLVTELTETTPTATEHWFVHRDLLGSNGDARHFVVEVDGDATARLRFGDDRHGRRPAAEASFFARYRVGNGTVGNVGAEAIAHVLVPADRQVRIVRNLLPAAGGTDPEDLEQARRDAPHAFRTQQRAVTAADYAAAAERLPDVQRAAASFRWTGSWHTVFVTSDRLGGLPIDAAFSRRMRRHLERFRMAGYDLELDTPRFVPLDIELHVCVGPGYFASDVVRAVGRALSTGTLPDGTKGLFHPDHFSFGAPVYLSRVIAAAQAVTGVSSVRALRFQRLLDPSPISLQDGVIPMGRLEIAQLANDPSFPERGRLAFSAGGDA